MSIIEIKARLYDLIVQRELLAREIIQLEQELTKERTVEIKENINER